MVIEAKLVLVLSSSVLMVYNLIHLSMRIYGGIP